MVIIHDNLQVPADVLRIQRLLDPYEKNVIARIRRSGHPTNFAEEGEEESGSGEGGQGEGEGSGSSASSGQGEGESESGSGAGKTGTKEQKDESGSDGNSSVPTSELQRLRRIAREKDEADRKRKDEQEKELQKKKKEEGRWQELLGEESEKTRKAEGERDTAVAELQSFKRRILVESVAKRLGWREPADAHLYLDAEDMDDEALAEAALKRVAKKKEFLVNPKKATGGPGPNNGAGGLSVDDIKQMSQEEINRRWPEVQKVLEASGKR